MVRIESNYWTPVKEQIKNEKNPKINEAIVYSYQDDEKVLKKKALHKSTDNEMWVKIWLI